MWRITADGFWRNVNHICCYFCCCISFSNAFSKGLCIFVCFFFFFFLPEIYQYPFYLLYGCFVVSCGSHMRRDNPFWKRIYEMMCTFVNMHVDTKHWQALLGYFSGMYHSMFVYVWVCLIVRCFSLLILTLFVNPCLLLFFFIRPCHWLAAKHQLLLLRLLPLPLVLMMSKTFGGKNQKKKKNKKY